MNSKNRTLVLCIAAALCLCPIPSTAVSAEEQQTNMTKDAAQLKMEALEAELGEEGMKEVADYLALQASLPDVVKASPYSGIAFAATDNESQVAYLTAIDESDLEEEDKEKLKADLQDIWNRYPDEFAAADNLVLHDVAEIMDERLIARDQTNNTGITEDTGTVGKQEKESDTTQGSNSTSFINSTPFISSFWVLATVLGTVMYARRK